MALQGSGLGLRRGMMEDLAGLSNQDVDFLEVAPENWIGVGGRLGKAFREFTERFPFACHGLSLSIGSSDKLDVSFVKDVKGFLDEHQIDIYSEHLSYCSHDGHMYDLMPIPFTLPAAKYVADRIAQVQEILQRPLIMENVSTYASPGQEMSELDFLLEVVERADCKILLDVNNVYVNSINHGFDARQYIQSVPSKYIEYLHIAGHYDEAPDLLVDTHGASIKSPVWELLQLSYDVHGVLPTLLERDFNFPSVNELMSEVNQIKHFQQEACREQTLA